MPTGAGGINAHAARQSTAMDVRVNYYINGHHCKITTEYHQMGKDNRGGAISHGGTDKKSQLRLQLHVFV